MEEEQVSRNQEHFQLISSVATWLLAGPDKSLILKYVARFPDESTSLFVPIFEKVVEILDDDKHRMCTQYLPTSFLEELSTHQQLSELILFQAEAAGLDSSIHDERLKNSKPPTVFIDWVQSYLIRWECVCRFGSAYEANKRIQIANLVRTVNHLEKVIQTKRAILDCIEREKFFFEKVMPVDVILFEQEKSLLISLGCFPVPYIDSLLNNESNTIRSKFLYRLYEVLILLEGPSEEANNQEFIATAIWLQQYLILENLTLTNLEAKRISLKLTTDNDTYFESIRTLFNTQNTLNGTLYTSLNIYVDKMSSQQKDVFSSRMFSFLTHSFFLEMTFSMFDIEELIIIFGAENDKDIIIDRLADQIVDAGEADLIFIKNMLSVLEMLTKKLQLRRFV